MIVASQVQMTDIGLFTKNLDRFNRNFYYSLYPKDSCLTYFTNSHEQIQHLKPLVYLLGTNADYT